MRAQANLLKQLAALPGMSPAVLNKKWKELFDTTPPDWDRRAIVRKLAHRLQELSYGGLSELGSDTNHGK